MRQLRTVQRVALTTVIAVVVLSQASWVTPPTPPEARRGWSIYEQLCLACHGARGDGRGPAAPYIFPAPRDFTRGDFKWQSATAATDDDLRSTIALGAPGTAMAGFPLTTEQLTDVIEVVRAFAPPTTNRPAARVELGAPPPPDAARGAAIWRVRGCPTCHAATATLRPPAYDLAAGSHRPREAGADAERGAAALSIATGLAGTAMPSYVGSVPTADLWALADYVVSLHDRPHGRANLPPQALDAPIGAAVAPQGPPPSTLAPAQASLRALQCARCHAKQFREWSPSVHRGAASPGLLAQTEFSMPAGDRASCLACHAPLAEQATDAALRADSVSCAGCHLRAWTRHGPPAPAPSLLADPTYPLVTTRRYERAEFCLPCHQLRTAVAGKPLLDTYREWLTGPYMPRGVQCQHCHMANREHRVLGIHDPDTGRQAISLATTARRAADRVTVTAALGNLGAGHDLPTTTTPAIWLSITLLDARGQPIATDRERIGRDMVFDGAWHERADTRIAPGATHTMTRAWRTADAAVTARVVVEVHPDDYYERFYAAQLAGHLAAAQRTLYEQAARRATGSHYLAEQRDITIAN